MAYTKKTLADLWQSLADRHDNGTLPTDSATISLRTRLLNKGQAYCADRMRITKSTSLTTSSGTIALPDDFLVIDKVFIGDQEYGQVDQEDIAHQNGLVYWITGNQFDGFNLNTVDDDTFTVKYSFKPAEMTTSTDVCFIPDPEAVVAYAYSFLRQSETDPVGDADKSLKECDSRITEMMDAYTINNNFLGFTLPDGI